MISTPEGFDAESSQVALPIQCANDYVIQVSEENLNLIIQSLTWRVTSLEPCQRRSATEQILIYLLQLRNGQQPYNSLCSTPKF